MKKYIKYLIAFFIIELILMSIFLWKSLAKDAEKNKSITYETVATSTSSIEKTKISTSTITESSIQSTETSETTKEEKLEEAVNEQSIALTFDDGPKRETTSKLLDILSQKGIKATFFILGQNIDGNEDLLKRMKDEGHIIGSHSMYHHNLSQMNEKMLKQDVEEMDQKSTKLFKESFKYIRPPYGAANPLVAKIANRPLIEWSVDSKDWSTKNTQMIINQVTQTTQPGSIILMHDIYTETINAVPTIIDNLTQQGYNFVTVDALLNQPKEPLNYYGANDARVVK
ncbi:MULTISPECIES: polysaccharide deacetylase family protein [Vagococcus]|uniref:Peptidoglycan N-acetylglucosamine deacetylase n=1 Tax=Vagococcus fluvialis bH819 TaxID=1255619 RepID=A0A1X6WP56_9ENTE|nr:MULTISPECIES: polysaccharide deacetylase family protein [Vagococcus]SLM86048.1 Peptidoglycan N-acetylglucosamine deacetylase [Vagococcus fluvialis bH819]HCM88822.1 polysaccharide deacetylase [Vagococcus sp.]